MRRDSPVSVRRPPGELIAAEVASWPGVTTAPHREATSNL
jgi:hypothetical protein